MTYPLGRSGRGLFTGTAWHYAQYRPGYRKPFFDSIVAQFRLDGTGRLLDLGCGTGQLTLPLAEHVAEAVGMDPEPEMLIEAARQVQAAGGTNVTWAQGGSINLPQHHDVGVGGGAFAPFDTGGWNPDYDVRIPLPTTEFGPAADAPAVPAEPSLPGVTQF